MDDIYVRLDNLANHLELDLAHEIRRLIAADSPARAVSEAQAEAQRAKDLAAECRRQLRYRERDIGRLVGIVELNLPDPGDHHCFKSWCPHCATRKERERIRDHVLKTIEPYKHYVTNAVATAKPEGVQS